LNMEKGESDYEELKRTKERGNVLEVNMTAPML